MKKVWIVSEFFAPEETATAYILTKIANRIAENNDVNVITGPAFYEKDEVKNNSIFEKQEISNSIKINRVSDTNLDKNKLFTRILRFIILTFKLCVELWRNVKKNDSVFIVTNPAPLLLFVALLKKIKGFRLFILVHDVFPENTIPANIFGSSNNVLYKFLELIFRKSYQKADKLIVLGRDMKEVMIKKIGTTQESKIEIIENWADVNIEHKEKLQNNKIDIQYAGNIGRVQGIMNILNVFSKVNNENIQLTLWGRGALVNQVEEFILKNKKNNICFRGGYSRKEQNNVLNSANIAIVTLAEGMYGLGVPSKTYNILASGHPILFIGDLNSEIALSIKEYKCGVCFAANDDEGLQLYLESLSKESLKELKEMGQRALALSQNKYSEKIILDKYVKLFE